MKTIQCIFHGETERVLVDAVLLRYECKECKQEEIDWHNIPDEELQ